MATTWEKLVLVNLPIYLLVTVLLLKIRISESCATLGVVSTSSSLSTTTAARCQFQANMLSSSSPDFSCNSTNCFLPSGAAIRAFLSCDANEVAIGGQCTSLSSENAALRCLNGALEVKVQTHAFTGADRWNNIDVITFSGVTEITCQDCDDPCVFSVGFDRDGSGGADQLNLPSSSLCSQESLQYDLFNGDQSFLCKVPSGIDTTVENCNSEFLILTSTGTFVADVGNTGGTFSCDNGVLTAPVGVTANGGAQITGNVLAVSCDVNL